MKLKDIFSLPKNSDSLKIIKDFLGQNLNYKEFYTDTLIDQVYELDKILIDKFNLKVPF